MPSKGLILGRQFSKSAAPTNILSPQTSPETLGRKKHSPLPPGRIIDCLTAVRRGFQPVANVNPLVGVQVGLGFRVWLYRYVDIWGNKKRFCFHPNSQARTPGIYGSYRVGVSQIAYLIRTLYTSTPALAPPPWNTGPRKAGASILQGSLTNFPRVRESLEGKYSPCEGIPT